MRSAAILKPATVIVLGVVIAIPVWHKHSIDAATDTVQHQLASTMIDFSCENMAHDDAFRLLHKELALENPYFSKCEFQLDYLKVLQAPEDEIFGKPLSEWNPKITLTLRDCTGLESLVYLCELSGVWFELRPRKVIVRTYVMRIDERDSLERAYDGTVDACLNAKYWVETKLGLRSPPPVTLPGPSADPFAHPPP